MWLLGRAHLNYSAVLQILLNDAGIGHVRPGMGHVLFALYETDGLAQTELGAKTGLAPSSITELVQRMHRAGLVKKTRDRTDRRITRITLSAAGRKLQPKCNAVSDRLRTIVDDGISPGDGVALRAVLTRVVHNLKKHLAD
jgi:MarR family transcriptional regulator, organic hydroperoxide resistance regulator